MKLDGRKEGRNGKKRRRLNDIGRKEERKEWQEVKKNE